MKILKIFTRGKKDLRGAVVKLIEVEDGKNVCSGKGWKAEFLINGRTYKIVKT